MNLRLLSHWRTESRKQGAGGKGNTIHKHAWQITGLWTVKSKGSAEEPIRVGSKTKLVPKNTTTKREG